MSRSQPKRTVGRPRRTSYGIEHYYYPPLYFLAFAPFWSDQPSFVEGYPSGGQLDHNYLTYAGRRVISPDYLARVPPPLLRLYRQVKLFSLGLGLACLLALAETLRLLFPGAAGWWVAVLGTAPLALLPQFLYYSTLVNNDTLVNALGAFASLAFTGAVLALEKRDEKRYLRLSLATAVCIGLAFLTKMSALVYLPLTFGLIAARWKADRGTAARTRIRRALSLLAALSALIVVCGGWWLVYKASQGDWNSFHAHRLAHPWAVETADMSASPWRWMDKIVRIARSYYAQFAGALFIGVPDMVFIAWLVVPFIVCVCAATFGIRHLCSHESRRSHSAEWDARKVVWATFAAVLLLNVAGILMNIRYFRAAYGRLLFPSLVALHTMAAAIVFRALRERTRVVATVTLFLVAYLGVLFGWTFLHRLAAAVTQPREDVRVVTGAAIKKKMGPIWGSYVDQPLRIPAGNLVALRIDISRESLLPQFGASLEGSLELHPAGGASQVFPLKRIAVGDNDFCEAWAELALESTVHLGDETQAILHLWGSPSWWFPEMNTFTYRCSRTGHPANRNGTPSDCALCVAAVYRS